jgi:delta 1-pyrroline-5-carboxylate dehydrogenase
LSFSFLNNFSTTTINLKIKNRVYLERHKKKKQNSKSEISQPPRFFTQRREKSEEFDLRLKKTKQSLSLSLFNGLTISVYHLLAKEEDEKKKRGSQQCFILLMSPAM